jgi:hypothetical protein
MDPDLEIKEAYYVGTHRYSYHTGVPAKIIGIKYIKPKPNLDERLCYHLEWLNGDTDYANISDGKNYIIITEKQYLNNDYLKVTK